MITISLSFQQAYEVACFELRKKKGEDFNIFSSVAAELIRKPRFPFKLAFKICQRFRNDDLIMLTLNRSDCPSRSALKLVRIIKKDYFFLRYVLPQIVALPDLSLVEVMRFVVGLSNDDNFRFYDPKPSEQVEFVTSAVIDRQDFQSITINNLERIVERTNFLNSVVFDYFEHHRLECTPAMILTLNLNRKITDRYRYATA